MYLWKRIGLFLFAVLLFYNNPVQGQQPTGASQACTPPSFSNTLNEPNLLTEQQEEWLGEIMAQQLERDFHVIPDPEGHLEKLGSRLLAQLPPTKIHYRFAIIDVPINNAFSIAGGRVYVARRLIELAQSEDDLAAVVAHEIGHGITHQLAIEISRAFRLALGVTQLGDRKDVLDKWNQLVDIKAKKNVKFEHGEQDEVAADRVSLYAMTRAGYDPQHAFDFFDRVTQTKGNTGGFWSDLFHQTKPESRRLREMLRNSAPLPQGCITALPADNGTHFLAWQKAVVESQFSAAKEEIPGLQKKMLLKPLLRGDLQQIQFSPDGKYLLAQDDSSVFVLSREPLANLFRIDAPDSYHAHFTPDSNSIVFFDKELRVQKWDVGKHERSWIHQVNVVGSCLQTSLSPSGEALACVTPEREEPQFDVQLIDVATSQAFYTHKKFYEATAYDVYLLRRAELDQDEPLRLFNMGFSPDDHYFVIGHSHAAFGYDLKTKTEIDLPGRLRQIASYSFAFLAPDQVAGYEPLLGSRKIVLARFPSGEVTSSFPAPAVGELGAPSKGNYLLFLNSGKYSVVVFDLQGKKIITASRAPGYAIYDQISAGETVGGELALIQPSDGKALSRVALPDSPLEVISASAFSRDGKWLALSGRTRGGIWNLESGDRVFLTLGFQGALFDQDQLIAQFPQKEPDPARVVKLDIPSHTTDELYKIDLDTATTSISANRYMGLLVVRTNTFSSSTRQIGELLVTTTADFSGKHIVSTLSIKDVRTNKPLWERKIEHEAPWFNYSTVGKTLTLVIASYDNIKAEAKDDPSLSVKLNAIEGKRGKKDSYVLRAFDAMTGRNLGAILVDTGDLSFKVRSATTIGDTVLVSDSRDRTLIYSLKTGEQKGKILGLVKGVSKAGNRILVDTGKEEADLYDVASLQPITHFTFPTRILRAEFTDDGNSISILTADQNVYSLKNPGDGHKQETATGNKQ
jgi:Peptidase family M48